MIRHSSSCSVVVASLCSYIYIYQTHTSHVVYDLRIHILFLMLTMMYTDTETEYCEVVLHIGARTRASVCITDNEYTQ